MGLSFVGCVVVTSIIVVMTGMALLGAYLSMWLMERFLTFMAEETMPPDQKDCVMANCDCNELEGPCNCGECLECVREERAWYKRFEAGEFALLFKCKCGFGVKTEDDLCPRCK